MSAAGFEAVRRLVREHAGLVLDHSKDYLIVSRLEPLARREGFGSLEELFSRLMLPGGTTLKSSVVEALLTSETSFFRDLRPFDALRQTVLPALLQARRSERALRIWSAACASGQEIYSIAMLLLEHFPELAGWDVRLVASDLSEEMLSRTREAAYSQLEVNRGLPASLLVRFFEREDLHWRLVRRVRSMVDVRRINLALPLPPDLPRMDVVLLRNVLIYLDERVRGSVLEGICRLLRPDGVLIMGATETASANGTCFQPEPVAGTIIYRPRGRERGHAVVR